VPGTILPAHPPRKGVSKDGEASAGAARCDRGAEADPILWRVFAPVPQDRPPGLEWQRIDLQILMWQHHLEHCN
jgi:hypothetical protein